MPQLVNHLFRGKSSQKLELLLYIHFKKLPKDNDRPIGEKFAQSGHSGEVVTWKIENKANIFF
jgi:hypothetical protein